MNQPLITLAPGDLELFIADIVQDFHQGKISEICRLGGTGAPKWSVTTVQGKLVIRIRADEFAGEAKTSLVHAALVHLKAAGLPVPLLLRTASGSTVIRRNNLVIEVLSWIDGETFLPDDDKEAFELGVFLARFHAALSDKFSSDQKNLTRREDYPEALVPYLAGLRRLATSVHELHELQKVHAYLQGVQRDLDDRLYSALPHAMIHGDLHPGNIRFRNHAVSAVYDFDYLSYQARARDLSDAFAFFGSVRKTPFTTDRIDSLTQVFTPEPRLCRQIIQGYQKVFSLTDEEWRAFPLLILSRWLQMRLRGSRKVPDAEKLSFVLDQFFEVPLWLEEEGQIFFDRIRRANK